MPKKLSQKEYCQKVYECVGDKYTVISEYKNKRSPITLKCNIHNVEFTVTAECFMRGPEDVRGCCPECAKENNVAKYSRTEVECAYCGIKFMKKNYIFVVENTKIQHSDQILVKSLRKYVLATMVKYFLPTLIIEDMLFENMEPSVLCAGLMKMLVCQKFIILTKIAIITILKI